MPLTSSTVDAFGWVTLVLVILLCVAGILCVAYVLYFRSKIHRGHLFALRYFNSLWAVRLSLIVFGILWGLVELLRLPLLRRKGWPLYSLDFVWQANLCKVYSLMSFGLAEPCFFLSALFLVQGSLRAAPFTPRKKWNGKVIALILICCLPLLLTQILLVIVIPSLEFRNGYREDREGFGLRIPPYFTRVFIREVVFDGQGVAVCTFPLLSTLVLALFGCIFDAQFLYLGWKIISMVINRRLQGRVCGLVLALALLLPVHASFLGLSALSKPGNPFYEIMAFLGFVTVLLSISVGEGILVVCPIADALAVRWVFDSMQRRRQFGDDIALDSDAIPLTVIGVEDGHDQVGMKETLFRKATHVDYVTKVAAISNADNISSL